MDGRELNDLYESYLEVYMDEEKRPIYGRGGEQRRTQTSLQVLGKHATTRDKKTKHNIPRGGTTISGRDPQGERLFTGEQDRGKGSKAARRAAALKPKEKRFPNRLVRSDKQGIKDSYEYDLYDIILSHLLDEGYAETLEAAEVMMVNMSEEWRDSIMEKKYEENEKLPSGLTPKQKYRRKRKQFLKKSTDRFQGSTPPYRHPDDFTETGRQRAQRMSANYGYGTSR